MKVAQDPNLIIHLNKVNCYIINYVGIIVTAIRHTEFRTYEKTLSNW